VRQAPGASGAWSTAGVIGRRAEVPRTGDSVITLRAVAPNRWRRMEVECGADGPPPTLSDARRLCGDALMDRAGGRVDVAPDRHHRAGRGSERHKKPQTKTNKRNKKKQTKIKKQQTRKKNKRKVTKTNKKKKTKTKKKKKKKNTEKKKKKKKTPNKENNPPPPSCLPETIGRARRITRPGDEQEKGGLHREPGDGV